jgi:ribosomal protein S18 acetylase RimI-like enzyme
MSVHPAYQGRGISKHLLDRCLDEARKTKAEKVSLFSNSQLQAALKLYEKYGFHRVAVTDTPMLTADVKMELSLSPNQ